MDSLSVQSDSSGYISTGWTLGPLVGSNSASISSVDTLSGSPTSYTFTVEGVPGPPDPTISTIQVSSSGTLTANGTAEANILITLQEAFRNPLQNYSASQVVLHVTGTGNTITQPTGVTDSQGRLTAILKSTTAEVKGIQFSAPSTLADLEAEVTFVAGPPAKLGFGSAPSPIHAGTCSGPYVVQFQDAQGNFTSGVSSLTINLSGQGSGQFFNDSSCLISITQLSIAAGPSSVQFYFKDPQSETLNLRATDNAGQLTYGEASVSIPSFVLGQSHFSTGALGGTSDTRFNQPSSVASDDTRLLLADSENHRVVMWNAIPTRNETVANLVLGQPTLVENDQNGTPNNPGVVSAQSLNSPNGVYIRGTRVYVADTGNNRVLGWLTIPTSNHAAADFVLGQTDMTRSSSNAGGNPSSQRLSGPTQVFSTATKLFVADQQNHRILIWNSLPSSDSTSSSVVLGQSVHNQNTLNNGGLAAKSLNSPYGVTVTSDSKLIVTDKGNNRVLIWNSIPTSSFASANVVIGQPNMTSNAANNGGIGAKTLNGPTTVFESSGRLYVVDSGNHRVLIWNQIPTSSNVAADLVLGQPSFTASTSGVSSNLYYQPMQSWVVGSRLFIVDSSNHRLLGLPIP